MEVVEEEAFPKCRPLRQPRHLRGLGLGWLCRGLRSLESDWKKETLQSSLPYISQFFTPSMNNVQVCTEVKGIHLPVKLCERVALCGEEMKANERASEGG